MNDLLARVAVSQQDLLVLATVFSLLASVGAFTVIYVAYNLGLCVFGLFNGMSICVSPVLISIRIGHHHHEFTDIMFWSALGDIGTLFLLDRPIVLNALTCIFVLCHLAELVKSWSGICITFVRQVCGLFRTVCFKTFSSAIKAVKVLSGFGRRVAYTTGAFLVWSLGTVLRCVVLMALVGFTAVAEAAVIFAATTFLKVVTILVLAHGYIFLEVILAPYKHRLAIVSFALTVVPKFFNLPSLYCASVALLSRHLTQLWRKDYVCWLTVAVMFYFIPHYLARDTSLDWPVRVPAASSATCTASSANDERQGETAEEVELLDRDSVDNCEPAQAPPPHPVVWRYHAFDAECKVADALPFYRLVDKKTGKEFFKPAAVPGRIHPVYYTVNGRNLTYFKGAFFEEMGPLNKLMWHNGLLRPIIVFNLAADTTRLEEIHDNNV